MADCRYFPECQRCNEVGDSWIPCAGGSDGIQCDAYEPMPDVEGLLALADELGNMSEELPPAFRDMGTSIAHRIREALGEGES